MSDFFEFIHNSLRDIKENSGIDILHPRGVVIHGRTYPATDKILYRYNPDEIGVNATIPMENGTIVYVSGMHRNHDLRDRHTNRIIVPKGHEASMFHQIPTARGNRGSGQRYVLQYDSYAYRGEAAPGEKEIPSTHSWTPGDANPEEITHLISKWARLPFRTRNLDVPPSHPDHFKFTDDQQQQWDTSGPHHSVFSSGHPVQHPHEITIMTDPGREFSMHKYDINTEQLTKLF